MIPQKHQYRWQRFTRDGFHTLAGWIDFPYARKLLQVVITPEMNLDRPEIYDRMIVQMDMQFMPQLSTTIQAGEVFSLSFENN